MCYYIITHLVYWPMSLYLPVHSSDFLSGSLRTRGGGRCSLNVPLLQTHFLSTPTPSALHLGRLSSLPVQFESQWMPEAYDPEQWKGVAEKHTLTASLIFFFSTTLSPDK